MDEGGRRPAAGKTFAGRAGAFGGRPGHAARADRGGRRHFAAGRFQQPAGRAPDAPGGVPGVCGRLCRLVALAGSLGAPGRPAVRFVCARDHRGGPLDGRPAGLCVPVGRLRRGRVPAFLWAGVPGCAPAGAPRPGGGGMRFVPGRFCGRFRLGGQGRAVSISGGQRRERAPGAVSYTHLDVYKRQVLPPVQGSGLEIQEAGRRDGLGGRACRGRCPGR